MFTVASVKLFDNNNIDVWVVETREEAQQLREKEIEWVLKSYPEVDFNVVGSEHSKFKTVISDSDKQPWMVVKITNHNA